MSKKRRLTLKDLSLEFIVGLFFFGAVGLLAWFTIVLSRGDLLHPQTHRTVIFPEVAGLNEGDNVLVRGVRVGRVERIQLRKNGVYVDVALDQPVTFYRNYLIEIRYSSVLGGRYLFIYEGAGGAGLLPPNALLHGQAPKDLMTETAKLVESLKTDLRNLSNRLQKADLIGKLSRLADNTQMLVDQVRTGKGTLGRLIRDPELYDRTVAAVKNLEGAGRSVQRAADTIQAAVADARRGKGTVGKLLVDDSLYRNADVVLARIRSGKGSLGRLITDDSLYTNLNGAARDFRQAAHRLAGGKSSLGRLISDNGAAYEDLKAALAAVRQISEKVRAGQGTLGKLVQDPALYDDARRTVNEVRRAVEDFRQQTPVSTFGSLVFGAL